MKIRGLRLDTPLLGGWGQREAVAVVLNWFGATMSGEQTKVKEMELLVLQEFK